MIIRSQQRLPLATAATEVEYPVLPLMTGVLFPGSHLILQVGRPENVRLVEDCFNAKREFVASYCHTEVATPTEAPIHQVGVLAAVRDLTDGPGGSRMVTLEGIRRVSIARLSSDGAALTGGVYVIDSPPFVAKQIRARMDEVIGIAKEITHLDPIYSPEVSNVLQMSAADPSLFADRVAATFHFSLGAKQELLEAVHLDIRYERLVHFLNAELSRVATMLNINENTRKRIESEQHRYYLKQQLYEIRRQLGEDMTEEKEAARFRNLLKTSGQFPPDVVARARIEIDRLSQLSPASAEYGVTKAYLDWLLNLPWAKTGSEDYEIAEAAKILASDYYGSHALREQILQRLSVRKLLRGADEAPTLCLVGAPGTGKASLAKAIARALGKEFVRISIGGVKDMTEIKGSARTFLGALPGRLVRMLREAGTSDPVALIEDLDYFNVDNDSSVNMALMDAIDARRNARFLDHYIGLPIDLSRVFFICSVRSYEELPEQFMPRLEIIELPGYIEREKVIIARKFIIPKMLKRHGLSRSDLRMNEKTLTRIITSYTQESGLVGFSQQIEKICRRIALEKADHKKAIWQVTEKNLGTYLGTAPFIPERPEKQPEIGIAAGLAWTGNGGELMFIEGLKMKGNGEIITTGSLGDVMRESIQAAHSYIRSKADMLGIDFADFNESDIHIHFPSGAVPKDGPSAGLTVCLVLASVMAERPIRNDIAMTGEITLRGRVLPVSGLKEKVAAAYRAGILNLAVPKENEKDTKELPREILKHTKFHFIDRVDELFELCLLQHRPSAQALQKVFTSAVARARARKKSRQSRRLPVAARSRSRS